MSLIWGILVAIVIAAIRSTKVIVTSEGITISKIYKKVEISFKDFCEPEVIKKKSGISIFVVLLTKIYLKAEESGEIRKYRLNEFSEEKLEEVMHFVRLMTVDNMALEEKFEVQDALNEMTLEEDAEDVTVFRLPLEAVKKGEKMVLLFWLGLAGLSGVLVLLTLNWGNVWESGVLAYFFAGMMCICLLAVPVQFAVSQIRIKKCPEYIRMNGNGIQIGKSYYSVSGVKTIRTTSPRKKTDSIFPVQYHMTVKAMGEKKNYYLGSELTFDDYQMFCELLEQVFVMEPQKLKFR